MATYKMLATILHQYIKQQLFSVNNALKSVRPTLRLTTQIWKATLQRQLYLETFLIYILVCFLPTSLFFVCVIVAK